MSKLKKLYNLASKPGVNYYTVLGIPRDATNRELRKEYRKLSVITHPDNYAQDTDEVQAMAESCSALINVMYSTLIDSDKRTYYDKHGKAMESHEYNKIKSAEAMSGNVDKIFENIEAYTRGGNIVVTETVPLKKVCCGGSINVKYELKDGTEKKSKVNIPLGMPNGTAVILEGLGDPGVGEGKSGDLIVVMVYRGSKTVQFSGANIKMLIKKPENNLKFDKKDVLTEVKLFGKWVNAEGSVYDKKNEIYTIPRKGLTNMLTMEVGDLMLKVIA